MVDRSNGGFSWGDFKDSGSTGSWADAAESAPAPPGDDDFPELDVKQGPKKTTKPAGRQQPKPMGRQMDPELANLPRGSSGRDDEDRGRGGDRYGDRERGGDRYERRNRREDDMERPPSKADENRDWRKGPSGDNFGGSGGFQDRNNRNNFGGNNRNDFGGNNRNDLGGNNRNDFGGNNRNDFGGNNRNDFGSDFRMDRDRPRRPRTVPGNMALERDYPTDPPFTGFISNIKFEATEDDMGNFLIDSEIDLREINWDMDDGKFRGSCSVIVGTLDSLHSLMKLDGSDFCGRTISIGLPISNDRDRRRPDMRRGPQAGGYQQPQERKKLALKPRTAPAETSSARPSGIFGDATPVDSESIIRKKSEQKEQEEKEKAEKAEQAKKEAELKREKERAEKKANSASLFGDASPVDSTKIYIRKTAEPVASPEQTSDKTSEQPKKAAWGPRGGNTAPSRSDGSWGRGKQNNTEKTTNPKKTEKTKAPPTKEEDNKKPTNVFALLEEDAAE